MSQQIASLTAQIGAETRGFEQGAQRVKNELKGLVPGLEGARKGLTGFVSDNAGLIAILTGVGLALKKQFDEYNEYVDVVRETARALGTTSEEASRLIQVADDVTISQQSLTTAFKLALKDGYEPTIDGLARMSDEYLALAPGTERAQYLLDRFGKSGMEMGKLLDIGSKAIKDQAAAVEDGLIVTQKAMEQQRKYEISLDALGDSFKALAYQAMPPIVDALTSVMNQMRDNARVTEILKDKTINFWTGSPEIVAAAQDQARAERELADANLLAADAAGQAGGAFETQAEQLKKASDAAKELSDMYGGMIGTIQSMQDAEDEYTKASLDLTEQRYAAQAKLDDLRSQGYSDQSEEVQKALEDLNSVKQAEEELALARERQALEFVSQILQEQLARDGWTQTEFEAFAKQQEAWGLWSADTVAKAQAAWMEADKITASINGIPAETLITITTNHVDTYGDGLIGPNEGPGSPGYGGGAGEGKGTKNYWESDFWDKYYQLNDGPGTGFIPAGDGEGSPIWKGDLISPTDPSYSKTAPSNAPAPAPVDYDRIADSFAGKIKDALIMTGR